MSDIEVTVVDIETLTRQFPLQRSFMRDRMDRIVRSAMEQRRAVGAFTCYDLATAYGVVSAAQGLTST